MNLNGSQNGDKPIDGRLGSQEILDRLKAKREREREQSDRLQIMQEIQDSREVQYPERPQTMSVYTQLKLEKAMQSAMAAARHKARELLSMSDRKDEGKIEGRGRESGSQDQSSLTGLAALRS